MEKKYDIFISYSRKDLYIVRPFVDELETRDFKVWLDLSEIDYGEAFPDRIAEALDASDSILFMCTPNSLAAPYCKKEIGYARTNGKKIRAILVDGIMPKKGWFALDYQDVNCINITKDEQKRKFFEDIESVYQPEKAAERARKIEEVKAAARRKVHEEEIKRIQEAERRAREEELARIRRREEDERFRKEAEEKASSKAAEMARKVKEADEQNKQRQQRYNYKNYGNAVLYIFWAVVLIGGGLGLYSLNFGNDSEDVDNLIVEQVHESLFEQAISGTDNYDYVDLGLSVMWATKNIGAVNLYSLGDRFVFGSTRPCVSNLYDECHPFQDNIADKHLLGKEEDAAYKLVGEKWRIPTQGEFEELLEKCSWKKVTLDECGGFLVTGVNGNSIFLPYQEYWLRDFMSHISAAGGPSVEIATFSGGDDKFHIGLYDASHEFRTAHIRPVRMK